MKWLYLMTKNAFDYISQPFVIALAALFFVVGAVSLLIASGAQAEPQQQSGKKFVTIYDRGQEKTILSSAPTVKKALEEAAVTLDGNDRVEPSLDRELTNKTYYVNIYRARPVIVVDGPVREKIMTAYQTPDQIAEDAGLALNDQDKTSIGATKDIIAEGAGLELVIDRATPFTLMLYGKKTAAYTQATTVGEMFKEKDITIGADDHVSVATDMPMTSGMTVSIWRNGVQTLTEEKEVAFTVEKVYDTSRPAGYREVQSAGVPGTRSVTYEVVMQKGREMSRKEIQNIVIKQPKKQVEIIGLNPGNGLTKSKGAHMFKDSKGVTHRETYYDLPMNVVMRSCGAGGQYSVRPDGAKVDNDGYVIIAAHLGNYPRCSVVETSLGPGKVYDTGSFTSKHPHGFDLATDWTNNDGR